MIESRKANMGQGGFTLIELLVVVAILAVLGGAAVIGIGQLRSSSKAQVCKTEAETVETAAHAYVVAENDPSVTDGATIADLVTEGYLRSAPNPDHEAEMTLTILGDDVTMVETCDNLL